MESSIDTKESSIDTIRKFARLPGRYRIETEDCLNLNTDSKGISTIGLKEDELKGYEVYPIVSADSEKTTYYSQPAKIQFVNDTNFKAEIMGDRSTSTVPNTSFSTLSYNERPPRKLLKLSDNIIIKCMDPDNPTTIFPSQDFWCKAFNKTHLEKYIINPIHTTGQFIWYYGKKIGSKGGRPRRRTTFRQRRLKRTTSKSRRATRRTRRRV
jgi:hypothetical protein